MIKGLGAQRISPQPAASALTPGGITYTFPASGGPAIVEISLEPVSPGSHDFRVQAASSEAIDANVFVVP